LSFALLCPGQGAQHVGMGVDWADRSAAAKEALERCSAAIDVDLVTLCRQGPAEQLTRTDVCQPAILAASAACMAALQESGQLDLTQATATLGLSLGEYTALYAAGVLDLEDAAKLVRLRGEAMQDASNSPPSGMTSLIGADRDTAEALCADVRNEGGVCVVANLNAPGQVVISGDKVALDRAEALSADRGIRRAIRLEVAGAFHSPLMEPARERLETAIGETAFHAARCPVIGNVTAEPSTDPDTLKGNLVKQLTSPVLFELSMRRAIDDGIEKFVELSPGRVLTGLMKKVDRKFPVETFEGATA
jgi:[acyl-carrier-protein] S-malonyltransferase